MKTDVYLIMNNNGKIRTVKNKPSLNWNEIAIKININLPNELFIRPTIEANIDVKDIPNTAYEPDLILNTKELIEQQTGAKIEMKLLPINSDESEVINND